MQRYLSIHSDLRLPPGRREAEIVHRGYHAGVRDGLAVVREQETRRWAAMRHDDDGEYDALEEQQIEEEEMEEEEEEDYFLRSTDRGYQRPTRSTRGANGKSMGSAGGGRREGQGANRQKNPRSGTGIARSVGGPLTRLVSSLIIFVERWAAALVWVQYGWAGKSAERL